MKYTITTTVLEFGGGGGEPVWDDGDGEGQGGDGDHGNY